MVLVQNPHCRYTYTREHPLSPATATLICKFNFVEGVDISYYVIRKPDHPEMDPVSREVWDKRGGMVLYVVLDDSSAMGKMFKYTTYLYSDISKNTDDLE